MADHLLRYRRLAGGIPPNAELLDLTPDGGFDLWRTRAEAFAVPTPIGRFRGTLDADLLNHVAGLTQAVAGVAPPPGGGAPSGSPMERVEVPGTGELEASANAEVPDEWKALAAQARELAVDLTSSPAGAVALVVSAGGARLEHRGTEPLTLDLSGAEIRAIVWTDAGIGPSWSWREGSLPDTVEATDGWTMDLPFEHGLDPAGGRLVGYVELRLLDGVRWLDGSLESGGNTRP
jgi:hypothetical protein